MNKKLLEFSVEIYGEMERYNDVISKTRCRIFYKNGNRNGTYITDEFAEKLLKTLPYAPIKGIYEYDDYSDHGTSVAQGRIYGIVPQEANISWETHLDSDNVEREYACADVLIFTALYPEASEIVGKSLSMELYGPTLQYHMAIIDGQKWYVFDEGSFLGLQVLGDDVEPCFEGASFYTLQTSIQEVIEKIEAISSTYANKGGSLEMEQLNFKLSDREKFDALWILLNENYNEENEWAIEYSIIDIYDEYALVKNHNSGQVERIYYAKDDEANSLSIINKVEVYFMDITAKEKETIEVLRSLNGDTYELMNPVLEKAQENFELVSEFSAKIEELESEKITLTMSKEEAESALTESLTNNENLKNDIAGLNQQIEELNNYKINSETEKKMAVIEQYKKQLNKEVLDSYIEKIQEFDIIELDKELTYELKKHNPSVFSKNTDVVLLPKDIPASGIEGILSRYKK